MDQNSYGEVRLNYTVHAHVLTVNAPQLSLLLLYNDVLTVTLADMQRETHLHGAELAHCLKALVDAKLVQTHSTPTKLARGSAGGGGGGAGAGGATPGGAAGGGATPGGAAGGGGATPGGGGGGATSSPVTQLVCYTWQAHSGLPSFASIHNPFSVHSRKFSHSCRDYIEG